MQIFHIHILFIVLDVLIEIACVGICGSDVHYLTKGRIGDFVLRNPMIIGHEASGTVVKTGANVQNLKVLVRK